MQTGREWDMMDAASRPRRWKFYLCLLGSLLPVVFYILMRNYGFVRAGMLNPNFEQIHRAFDFNLWELPWTLLIVAVVLLVLSFWGRRMLRWVGVLYLFLSVDLFLLRYYVNVVEPNAQVVRSVRLETAKLQQTLRLLHVSDIQSGGITEVEVALFEKIAELEPDIIIYTGDFLQVVPPATFEGELPKLIELIREVNPRYGSYGVIGDTDQLSFYRLDLKALKPMELLSSKTLLVETDAGLLSLHGLNLSQSRDAEWAQRSIDIWLERSDVSEFRVLFGHSPNFALGMQSQPIDLCLAGHTHGGQVRVPFYGPLVIDSDVPREWSMGFRRIGIPFLNVSAGAGSNRHKGLPKIRFNCPSEMTLIELVPIGVMR